VAGLDLSGGAGGELSIALNVNSIPTSTQTLVVTGATCNLTGGTLSLHVPVAASNGTFTVLNSSSGALVGAFSHILLNGRDLGATPTTPLAIAYTSSSVTVTLTAPATLPAITWTGATSSAWSVGTNWSSGVAPMNGDFVILTGAGIHPTNQDIAGLSLAALTYDATTNASYVVSGSTLTFNSDPGTITLDPAAANQTMNVSVALNSPVTVSTVSAKTLTFIGTLTGSGSLTKVSTGTLALRSSNTYSGSTIVSGGVLQLGSSDPRANLVDYYPFDTNANDMIGTHNGTISNGSISSSQSKLGGASVHVTGTGTGVSMGALGFSGNASRTISAWVKQDAAPAQFSCNYFGWFSSSGTQKSKFYFDQNQSTGIGFTEYFNGSAVVQTNDTANFHMLTATWDGTSNNVQLYCDGALKTTLSYPSAGVEDVFGIDVQRTAFAGYVDDLRVYNIALSAAQVAQLYNWDGTQEVFRQLQVCRLPAVQH